MGTVPVVFSTSALPGAIAIRMVTWSDWSHVAILDHIHQEVIEAVWPKVRVTPLDEFIAKHPKHDIAYLSAQDPGAVIAAARDQVGKPYDLAGVIGLGLHRNWQEESAWWCSELVAWSFDAGGSPLFRAEALRRITPQHLWMLNAQSSS